MLARRQALQQLQVGHRNTDTDLPGNVQGLLFFCNDHKFSKGTDKRTSSAAKLHNKEGPGVEHPSVNMATHTVQIGAVQEVAQHFLYHTLNEEKCSDFAHLLFLSCLVQKDVLDRATVIRWQRLGMKQPQACTSSSTLARPHRICVEFLC